MIHQLEDLARRLFLYLLEEQQEQVNQAGDARTSEGPSARPQGRAAGYEIASATSLEKTMEQACTL